LAASSSEGAAWPFLFDSLQESLTDEQIEAALMR
jgi:hypothetical protein